ncbi:MAG: hypothetical protein PHU32_05760 [Candidatus ainarchaeum sp.]|nr:hypothetical protein [Candidatus ainarchaeum sp.]
MPLYLEIIFEIVGFLLSALGILFGAKALFAVQNKNIQKTKSGVNYQDNKIYNGLTADDIVKIIQNLPQSDVQRIYNEMVKKFEEIDKELAMRSRTFISKDEPTDMKEGDIWLHILDDDNNK